MDKQEWLEIYQQGPQAFEKFIRNYSPLEKDRKKLTHQKKLLDIDIEERCQNSSINKYYIFPRQKPITQQSSSSLLDVSKYDLRTQNPWCCSLMRVCQNKQKLKQNQNISSQRKIMRLNHVKSISRQSTSRRKKKQVVKVRQIHLVSTTKQQTSQSPLAKIVNQNQKKLLTVVKRKNLFPNHNKSMIHIVNKPDNNFSNVPQQTNINCIHNFSKTQDQNIQPQSKLSLRNNKRRAPDIRYLIIQKRDIKIITSQKFNLRRSKDKDLKLPRETSMTGRTLEQSKYYK